MVRPYPPGPAPAGPFVAFAIPVSLCGLVEYPGPTSTRSLRNAVDTSRWLIPAGFMAVLRGSTLTPAFTLVVLFELIPPPDLIVTIAISYLLTLRRNPETLSSALGAGRGSAHSG